VLKVLRGVDDPKEDVYKLLKITVKSARKILPAFSISTTEIYARFRYRLIKKRPQIELLRNSR
jgi:hypothetical protein